MKEKIKSYVSGFLTAVLFLGAGSLVYANTVSRNITYGVRINLNGSPMQLDADSQPFVMDGRTFLPVRAIAEAIGMPVDFNAGTNTVYLGASPHVVRTTETRLYSMPFQEVGNAAWFVSTGNEQNNTIRLIGDGRFNGNRQSHVVYMLDGTLNTVLTGTFLPLRDGGTGTATYRVFGNGRLLHETPTIGSNTPARPFEIDISGIVELRIEHGQLKPYE